MSRNFGPYFRWFSLIFFFFLSFWPFFFSLPAKQSKAEPLKHNSLFLFRSSPLSGKDRKERNNILWRNWSILVWWRRRRYSFGLLNRRVLIIQTFLTNLFHIHLIREFLIRSQSTIEISPLLCGFFSAGARTNLLQTYSIPSPLFFTHTLR